MSDFIVIGSGPGGSACALKLLEGGHRVTMLERGDFLPKEEDNRSSQAVYGDTKYRTRERWQDALEGEAFQPWMHYHVGGNAKIYGAALYRFRPQDFAESRYPDGLSPAWPIDYTELAPYYDEAETLYTVHGNREEDPTEPTGQPYPFAALEDESFIAELKGQLDIQTHALALGIAPEKHNDWELKLDKFDAYPDPSHSKSDPESRILAQLESFGERFLLRTCAHVVGLEFDAAGDVSAAVLANGERLRADAYVLAAGAVNSARILLASGAGQRNDLVGANYMAHLSTTGIARFRREHGVTFAKTFGSNEWCRPEAPPKERFGSIQTQGKWDSTQYRLEPWTTTLGEPDTLAARGIEFFCMTEDLPLRENRIRLEGDGLSLHRELSNTELHQNLLKRLAAELAKTPDFEDFAWQMMPIDWCTHQCGTLAFGEDPRDSVLDPMCRMHGSTNLHVTDASCFPSSTALNPTLTIIANALRVGEALANP